jgi:hypothetical protein
MISSLAQKLLYRHGNTHLPSHKNICKNNTIVQRSQNHGCFYLYIGYNTQRNFAMLFTTTLIIVLPEKRMSIDKQLFVIYLTNLG